MSYSKQFVYNASIASGASTSSSIKLDKCFSKLYVHAVTMSTGAALALQGSTDDSSFYKAQERVNTATVQWNDITYGTAASGGFAEVSFQAPYLRFTASAVVSGGVSITVLGID